MHTKYVRSHSGLFAIFSAGIGYQHIEMADHLEDARSMGDAGFVELRDGKFLVHGKSLTLGIAASKDAEDEMNAAFEAGEIRLYPVPNGGWIATNAKLPGQGEPLTDIDQLYRRMVFYRET